MSTGAFSTVKVFSCTMGRDREQLGERITEWLKRHPKDASFISYLGDAELESKDWQLLCVNTLWRWK